MSAEKISSLSMNSSGTEHFHCELPFNHAKELSLFNTGSFINRIMLAVIQTGLILPTIIPNVVIITAMIKTRTLWRSATILIGFLALTDAFVGFFSMPLFLSTVIMELTYGEQCYSMKEFCTLSKIALHAGDLGMGWSFITISLITFERYIAIFCPFWYRKHVRTSVIVKMTVVIWLLWAIIDIVIALNVEFEFIIGVIILALVIVLYVLAIPAYVRIVYLLNKLQVPQQTDVNRPRIDRKGSMTCAIMLVCLLLCYTPLIVVAVVIIVNGGSDITITYIFPWTRLLLLSNSFFNPMIYMARNRMIRRAVRDSLKKLFQEANDQTGIPSANNLLRLYRFNTAAVITNQA